MFALFAVAAISDLVFLATFLIFEVRNFFWPMVAKPLLAAGLIASLLLLAAELGRWLRRTPVTLTSAAACIMIIAACNLGLRIMDGPGTIIPLGASLSLLVILLIPAAIRRKGGKHQLLAI